MTHTPRRLPVMRLAGGCALIALLAGCEGAARFDEPARDRPASVAAPAPGPAAGRPAADARGVIAYPNYRVAEARANDTVADVARRVGEDPQALADFNGLFPGYRLRAGETLALPEGAGTGGGGATGGAGNRDIAAIAGGALARADGGTGTISASPLDSTTATPPGPATGAGPGGSTRHRVARGETAFSIAQLYGISPRALAEWNGLGPDFAVREGQTLIIPPRAAEGTGRDTAAAAPPAVAAPGGQSPVPAPPSARDPLPRETVAPAPPPSPDLGTSQTPQQAQARFLRPVDGAVRRGFGVGGNEGIDFAAPAGTTVRAAGDGEVALISKSVGDSVIVLVRHDDNLYTVYSNVAGAKVEKGQRVARGEPLAQVLPGEPGYVHFEVRRGTEATDPAPFLE